MKTRIITALSLGVALAITPAIGAFADEVPPPELAEVSGNIEAPAPTPAVEEIITPVEPESVAQAMTFTSQFEPYTVSRRWVIPATWDRHVTPYYTAAIFPQPPLDDGTLSCDRWSQDDVYLIDSIHDEFLYESLDDDGALTQGEDSLIYQSHVFTYGGDCPPPVVIPNSISTSHVQVCGSVDITLRNVSPWIYPTSVEIDGVHSYGPTVDNRSDSNADGKLDLSGPQKDQSVTRTISFAEDSGTHTVRYRVQAGSEKNLYVGLPVGEWTELTIETDCEPPVVIEEPPVEVDPAEPVWIDECGADNGYWSYEDGEGYSFHGHPNGELVLTAHEGYAFVEGQTTWWQEVDSSEECPITEEPPVEEPPVEEPPVEEPEEPQMSSTNNLADTGNDLSPLFFAAALLFGGAMLFLLRRFAWYEN